jgi:hypothetical protein
MQLMHAMSSVQRWVGKRLKAQDVELLAGETHLIGWTAWSISHIKAEYTQTHLEPVGAPYCLWRRRMQ